MREHERKQAPVGWISPPLLGIRRIISGPPTPSRLFNFLSSIRRENGSVDPKHPAINHVMAHALREKLDVMLTADGDGINAVLGKNLVHRGVKKEAVKSHYIRIGAGIAITTALVGGATGFIIRQHRRSKE